MYTRASASDYDDWKTVYENPGWGSDDLIPLLRKVGCAWLRRRIFSTHVTVIFAPMQTETYQVSGGEGPTHGTDGPLNVSPPAADELGEQFLQVARALDPARAREPSDADTNDLSTINVYTVGILINPYSYFPDASSAWPSNKPRRLRNGPGLCTIPLMRRAWLRSLLYFMSRWINGTTGVRSDVPHHLIYPLKETRRNLHVFTGIHVKRVTFDEYV